jgi:hypothetical protein
LVTIDLNIENYASGLQNILKEENLELVKTTDYATVLLL